MKTFCVMGLSLFALLISGFNSLYARPAEGSCVGHEFLLDGDEVDESMPVWALRNGASLYSTKTGSDKNPGDMKFGELLYPKRISLGAGSGRIEVRKSSQRWDESAGWVDRHEVLCRFEPLKSKKSLDQKAFINTSEGRSVPAYPGYNARKCSSCPKLERFQLYFIFAKDPDNKRYLVSQEFNLTAAAGHPLTGWVDEKFIIPWNTTLQVRPKEDVKTLIAESEAGQRIILSGGKSWFKMPYHLPLLGMVKRNGEKYYMVAGLGAGMPAVENLSHGIFYISIDKYEKDIVKEMWMKEADFDRWKVILEKVRKIRSGGFKKQKKQFVSALLSQIQMLLGAPPLGALKEIRQQLADRQESLPFREDSPLLQYSPDEIETIQVCEFNRLIKWIDSISYILGKVYSSPTNKITVQTDPFPNDCPFISEKGKNIKRITITNIAPFHKDDDICSYRQNLTDNKNDNRPIYIVPLEFLP
ncbi:MAG: hypothetical protein GY862_24715 [Gammaproteobacteria bacterium]|nr:hypothetical protein [Gammaproteobacteria bacterium]